MGRLPTSKDRDTEKRRLLLHTVCVFNLNIWLRLDALVTAGIVGNLIVFLLVKTTKLNPLRTALWTFLVVNAAPVLVLAIIGSRIDPQFRVGSLFSHKRSR